MKILYLLIFLLASNFSFSQDDMTKAFDFWVGDWEAHWKDAKGNEIIGNNSITKTCKGGVVLETFSDTTNQYFGTSISVFSPADSLWHQAWADNSGGYIDLVGVIDGDERFFQTKPVTSGDKTIIRRMRFYNIKAASFSWDWEISIDGGKTWKLSWHIDYVRKA